MSLAEALEIEAVKCAAGDARYEYQNFYSKWLAEQREQGADVSKLGELSADRMLEEIEMTRQAIDEHEELLVQHRQAIMTGDVSPLADTDVEDVHTTIAALRNTLVIVESEYAQLMSKAGE